jgi:hypothetical protein
MDAFKKRVKHRGVLKLDGVNIRVSNFFSIFEKSSGHKGNIVIIREAWMLLAQKNGH